MPNPFPDIYDINTIKTVLLEDLPQEKIIIEQLNRYQEGRWHRFVESFPVVLYRFLEGIGWTLGVATIAAQVFTALSVGVPVAIVVPLCFFVGVVNLFKAVYKQIERITEANRLKTKINDLMMQVAILDYHNGLFTTAIGRKITALNRRLPSPDNYSIQGYRKKLSHIEKEKGLQEAKLNNELNSRETWSIPQICGHYAKEFFNRFFAFCSGFGLSLTVLTFFLPLILATPTGLPFAAIYIICTLVGVLSMMTEYIVSRNHDMRMERLHRQDRLFTNNREIHETCNASLWIIYDDINNYVADINASLLSQQEGTTPGEAPPLLTPTTTRSSHTRTQSYAPGHKRSPSEFFFQTYADGYRKRSVQTFNKDVTAANDNTLRRSQSLCDLG